MKVGRNYLYVLWTKAALNADKLKALADGRAHIRMNRRRKKKHDDDGTNQSGTNVD